MRATRSRETLVKVAHMYYLDGRSQREIAATLQTTPSNVSRMLTSARESGIVQIRIDDPVARHHRLEQVLRQTFGLADARVLATLGEMEHLREGVGALAAGWLTEGLREGQRIALSWGTTLQAMVAAIQVERRYATEVVPLVGGLTGSASLVTGQELVRELAKRLGGNYHYLHAPAVFSSPDTRNAVLTEPEVQRALEVARNATVAIVGIGAFGQGSSAVILDAMNLSPTEQAELDAVSPVGDICGHFYDLNGRECASALSSRVVAIELTELARIPTVVGAIVGVSKARGLLGALHGGFLDVVVCDQALAERVLLLERSRKNP